MNGHGLAVVVWAVVLLDLLAVSLVVVGVLPEPPSSPQGGPAIFVVLTATFGLVGARVIVRDSRNPVGWILWLAPTLLALSGPGVGYARLSVERFDASLPGTALLAWAGGFSLVLFILLTALVIPMIFPNGRLRSRRWRAVAVLVAASIGLTMTGMMFDPAPLLPGLVNPFGIAGAEEVLGLVRQVGAGGILVALPLVISSVVVRFRFGGTVERQQVKWFAVGILVPAVLLAMALALESVEWLWAGSVAALGLIPVSIGIAILRYRLYEIDRIISRTIGWAVVTGVLVAVFAGLLVALQAVARPADQGEHPRGGRVHARRVRAVPAAAAAGPAGRGPALRPGPLRRAAHGRRLRRAPPQRGRPRDDPLVPHRHGERGRAADAGSGVAHEAGVTRPARFRNDVRTSIREDAPDDCNHSPLPPPRRQALPGHGARRRPGGLRRPGRAARRRRGHPGDRSPVRLPPVRTRSGRPHAPGARVAGARGAAEQRGRPRRAPRDPGRAHRDPEPRPPPVRAGVLHRRPPAARHAGRPGRARHPRRAARPRAGGRGRRARALRAGAQGRAAHPAAVPAARAAQPAASGRSPRTTAPPASSAATSTTSSTSARAGSASWSAT